MNRELSIVIESGSIQRSTADVVVVPFFEDERPLRGTAGQADWRLCGKLSALAAAGELGGAVGETALVATFGGLRTPLLLVLGAGRREDFDARAYQRMAHEATLRSLDLRVDDMALCLAPAGAGPAAQERRAAALVAGAAAAMDRAEPGRALQVRLLVPREEAARAGDLLRRARPGRLPERMLLHLPVAAATTSTPRTPVSIPKGSQLVK